MRAKSAVKFITVSRTSLMIHFLGNCEGFSFGSDIKLCKEATVQICNLSIPLRSCPRLHSFRRSSTHVRSSYFLMTRQYSAGSLSSPNPKWHLDFSLTESTQLPEENLSVPKVSCAALRSQKAGGSISPGTAPPAAAREEGTAAVQRWEAERKGLGDRLTRPHRSPTPNQNGKGLKTIMGVMFLWCGYFLVRCLNLWGAGVRASHASTGGDGGYTGLDGTVENFVLVI